MIGKKKKQNELDNFSYLNEEIKEKLIQDIPLFLQQTKEEIDDKKTSGKTKKKKQNDNVIRLLNSGIYFSYSARILINSILPILTLIIAIVTIIAGMKCSFIETISYSESGTSTYSVCLHENEEYESQCISENLEYISSLVNNIPAEFSYSGLFKEPVEKNIDYYIKADLKIIRNDETKKELYSKSYDLTEIKNLKSQKNVVSINENVNIPYEEYNDLVNQYLTKYSVDSIAKVDVSLILIDNGIEKTASMLSIPLSKQTFNVSKTVLINEDIIRKENNLSDLSKLFFTIALICGVVFIISSIHLVILINKYSVKDSKYIKELNKVLKEFDKVIVESKDSKIDSVGKTLHKVNSFLELVDARDTLEKPIVYVKINSIKSIFYVVDKENVYTYTMKESNFQ